MSRFLASRPSLAFQAEEEVSVAAPTGIQTHLSAVRRFEVLRPDHVRIAARGENDEAYIWYDGKQFVLVAGPQRTCYTVSLTGSVDEMLETMARDYGLVLPLTDLLSSDIYSVVAPGTPRGAHLGVQEVRGIACHHLAFEGRNASWQIWIEAGDRPVPHRFFLQYGSGPSYAANLVLWDLNAKFAEGNFTYTPPAGVRTQPLPPIAPVQEPQAGPAPEATQP
jgi:hypothetical protein